MMTVQSAQRNALAALAALLLVGCGGLLGKGTVEPTRSYLLEALAEQQSAEALSTSGLAVGVGPVELPRYLDRPGIVTRGAPNEIHMADFVQWGEPLADGVPRTLAENLSILLGTDRVYGFPAKLPESLAFRVGVEIIRFDGALGGEVRLEARWTLLDLRQGSKLVARRLSVKTRTVEGADYGALVTAMSRSLADLSGEIADTLRSL